jgi:hypothetical protein
MSRKFRVRCKIVVLLAYRFSVAAVRERAATEESVHDSGGMKH